MKIYESFNQFWEEFSGKPLNQHGISDVVISEVLHTSDKQYANQVREGNDELGFQPLSLLLVNPLQKTFQQALIKNVNDQTANKVRQFAKDQYIEELSRRFVDLRPDEFHAFTEYENWEDFYTNWLERAEKPVFNKNLPLLFDHTSKINYWTRKQTGQEVMPYQRLLITTFFIPKRQFYDFFIKNVDDNELERIKLLLLSRIELANENLFMQTPHEAHRA